MTQDEARLFEQALKLAPDARAALAVLLLDSLDSPPDPDADATWAAEISKRLQDIDSGSARLVPWAEARRQIAGS